VRRLVECQREIGLDIINAGEYTKGGDWLSFADKRLGGFTKGQLKGPPIVALGKDCEKFADFYKWACERGTLFFQPGDQIKTVRSHYVCTAPSPMEDRRLCNARLTSLSRPQVPSANCF